MVFTSVAREGCPGEVAFERRPEGAPCVEWSREQPVPLSWGRSTLDLFREHTRSQCGFSRFLQAEVKGPLVCVELVLVRLACACGPGLVVNRATLLFTMSGSE